MNLYSALKKPFVCKAFRCGPVCNKGITRYHTKTMPAFTPQPQGVTVLWLVLVAPTHE